VGWERPFMIEHKDRTWHEWVYLPRKT
jgi:hypothetical protein